MIGMKSTSVLLFLLLVLIAGAMCASLTDGIKDKAKLPSWVQCTSHSDCANDHCCTIAHERYSYPTCRRIHEGGDFCRPGGPQVTNGSRYYPDGLEIVLGDVYLMFCPCAGGLGCDPEDHVCRDPNDRNRPELA